VAENFRWLEVSITCSGELAEALAEALSRFAENGVVIESITTFDTDEYEFKATGNVKVIAYLDNNTQLETTRQQLEEALWHFSQIVPIPAPEYRLIQDEDWMAAWKKHYQPIKVGRKWLILPAWLEADPGEHRTIIRIDPAMAFGTGAHPSTQLCLLAIEDHLLPGQNVIDLGCGSGILAIAALKLGAADALAVDTDEQAVIATQNNARINGIHNHLATSQGSIQKILQGDFAIKQAPFVLANILAPVLMRLFKEGLADILTPGGKLVLAGILDNQVDDVIAAAKTARLALIAHYQHEDWVALVVG
jgi:ribosomal protein L11 methyltransferase